MSDIIRRSIAARQRRLAPRLAIAIACVAVATVVRLLIAIWIPTGIPYITFFPALLLATVLGGLPAGVTALLGSMAIGLAFFVEGSKASVLPGMIAFLVSGGLIVWLSNLVSVALQTVEEARQQERLLVLELQHRVKNTLSIVQALANQTFADGGESPSFRATFTDRLVALGRAHNVLSDTAWREVTIRALVQRAVEPFIDPTRPRIDVEGEDLLLSPALIVDLALCLHELATNATKYGALSRPEGRVAITWRRLDADRVELSWREAGGPAVQAPTRRGFGSRLLERGLSRGARPVVATDYAPGGLRWTAAFDAA